MIAINARIAIGGDALDSGRLVVTAIARIYLPHRPQDVVIT